MVGADLIAGSLIKNPGGTIAPCGGYVAGRRTLVEAVAARLSAPGLGTDCGATPSDIMRALFQGLFLAPQMVGEAIKVLGTVGGLGTASLSASLLTSILPTTMEDLLALALCSASGFVAISSFPAGRKEVINKVEKAANSLASEFEEAMEKDLAQSLENLELFVEYISRPYTEGLQHRIQYLSGIRKEIQEWGKN
ncbi:unnamed protein product [Victoria cruziana]